MTQTHYEVTTDNVYGSDYVTCETLEEAKKTAKEWADEIKSRKEPKRCHNVVIIKVTEEVTEKISVD